VRHDTPSLTKNAGNGRTSVQFNAFLAFGHDAFALGVPFVPARIRFVPEMLTALKPGDGMANTSIEPSTVRSLRQVRLGASDGKATLRKEPE
jgi:hypothetical protein